MTDNKDTPMRRGISIGDKYRPAMEITEQADADDYFARCVEHTLTFGRHTQAEAEAVERSNLGYFAGYYDHETRERVERLFRCSHPIFGSIAEMGAPSASDALVAGVRAALAVPRG